MRASPLYTLKTETIGTDHFSIRSVLKEKKALVVSFERFIAQKFLPRDRNHFSGPLVEIATYSIALGVIVMVMAVSILHGFQKEISRKVVGFGSHIVVKSFDLANAYEEIPISTQRHEVADLRAIPGVRHVQYHADKGGMIKTDDQIQGIIMKGVDSGFDTSFFAENIVEGRLFNLPDSAASNEVVISQKIANLLGLQIGDKAKTYFWQGESYRARAFTIVGIYSTDLTEFDEHYIVGDLRQIQKLNGWDSTQVAGYEVLVDDFENLNAIHQQVLSVLDYDLNAETIVERNLSLFSWLNLLNSNIALILAIMAVVCIVAIISALLIMIFEKTATIGVLKTIGADNGSIRKIFMIKSIRIISKGVALGIAVALALCLIQYRYKIVRLDSASYSMSCVPIDLNPAIFIMVGIGTIIVCAAALLIPASYISKIDPAKTIKVE